MGAREMASVADQHVKFSLHVDFIARALTFCKPVWHEMRLDATPHNGQRAGANSLDGRARGEPGKCERESKLAEPVHALPVLIARSIT